MSIHRSSIAILATEYPPTVGGVQEVMYQVSRRMDETAIVVAGACPGDKAHDANLSLPVLRVHLEPELTGADLWWARRQDWFSAYCLKVARRCWPALVRLHVRHRFRAVLCGTIFAGLAGLALKRLCGVPFSVILYAMEVNCPDDDLPRSTRCLWTHVLNEASAVFVISDFTAARAAGWLKHKDQLHKLPLGVELDHFVAADTDAAKQRLGLRDREIILTVGRLVQRKGHDTVLRALPNLIERYAQLTYLIVGDGPEMDRLRQMVEELSLSAHVQLHTNVPHSELPIYYQACDVFVMPCREIPETNDAEGFGLVFLEAAACRKPVVAGRSGGVPDAVIDGQTGLLVDPVDVAAVAQAVTQLLDDDALARYLGDAGRRRVETEMNWERTAETILQAMGLEHPSSP